MASTIRIQSIGNKSENGMGKQGETYDGEHSSADNATVTTMKQGETSDTEVSAAGEIIASIEIDKIKKIISHLLKVVDYSSIECTNDFSYLRKCAFVPLDAKEAVFAKLVDLGIAQLCMRAWNQLFWTDYSTPAWENLKTSLYLLWNGSDVSAKWRRKMADTYLPELLFQHLGHVDGWLSRTCTSSESSEKLSDDEYSSFNKYTERDKEKLQGRLIFVARSLVFTCFNIIQTEAIQDRSRKVAALETIQKLRDTCVEIGHKTGDVSAFCNILLAFIADESESANINCDGKLINALMRMLVGALKSPNHVITNFGCNISAQELAMAMNKMAMNDQNKEHIINEHGVDHYMAMLDPACTENEQVVAMTGLWTLSFTEKGTEAIEDVSGCLDALNRLKDDDHVTNLVRNTAASVLWNMKKGKKPTAVVGRHVMISYNWDKKELAWRIADRIKSEGYDVWIDKDKMSGSILEAMGTAVDSAVVVIACVTEKYKQSVSCRTEAEYAYTVGKPIIPIKLQHKYVPDGWLGALCGAKLYFDFDDNDTYDSEMKKFLHELQEKWDSAPHDVVDSGAEKTWTNKQVKTWLKDIGNEALSQRWPPNST